MPPASVFPCTPTTDRWMPPLDAQALAGVLVKVRQWTPFDGEALLDDVGAVLDDVVPREEDLEEHAWRLRGHLMQLVNIALAAEAGHKDIEADRLIRHARDVRAQEMPATIGKRSGICAGWPGPFMSSSSVSPRSAV